jgi:Zn-dependent peptidase ImmA (M78 family)
MIIMSDLGIKAPPVSYKDIEAIATVLRNKLKIKGRFPADKLEFILQILSGDNCPLGIKDDMEEEGRTLLNGRGIYLKSDVYDALIGENDPRARFTAMHELAHRILHCKPSASLVHCRGKVERYCDPEWQADALAGAILCPAHEIKSKKMSVDEIMREYRVSRPCAEIRFRVVSEKL